jgi:hypothetical protein
MAGRTNSQAFFPTFPLASFSAQPRLSIISGTLALALPDLLHFAVTVAICAVMFAAAAVLTFGIGQEQLSSFGQAVYFMMRYVLLRADEGVFQASGRLGGPQPLLCSERSRPTFVYSSCTQP